MKKKGDPYLAPLAYRSTPLAVGFSPAELLMSRKLHSKIPTTRESRKPEVPDVNIVRERDKQLRDKQLKEKQKQNFDNHHGARAMEQDNWYGYLTPIRKLMLKNKLPQGHIL